jgi:hypothetical protein
MAIRHAKTISKRLQDSNERIKKGRNIMKQLSQSVQDAIKWNDAQINSILNNPVKSWANLDKLDLLLKNRSSLRRKIQREYITKARK